MAASGNRFPFTQARLEALPAPTTGRATYHDARTAGLILRVTPAGVKTFCRYGKIGGRPTRVLLGRFPGLSVDDARKACTSVAAEVGKGNDPHQERIARRREQTLAALWHHWLETHAKLHKRSWKEDERQYNTYLKPWAGRQLSAISKADVQAWHAKIGREHGPYASNRALALLSSMYGKSGDIGYSGPNPADGVKRFPEEKRDRFLSGDELGRFFTALNEEPDHFQDFFLLCLVTGARRANVQAMAWSDVNLDIGLWHIPAGQAKAGEAIVVPLVPAAVDILRRRRETAGACPWVFPCSTRKSSRSGHMQEPRFSWQRIIERAGLQDVRLHDLRRTLGSWMAMGGAGLPIVGKMLGHRQLSTTEIYARLQVDPVRASAESATAAMLAFRTGANGTDDDGPTIDVEVRPVPAAEPIPAPPADDGDEPTEF